MPRLLISEADVRRAAACGGELRIEPDALLTPGAWDAALKLGVRVVEARGVPTPTLAESRRVVALGADHAGYEAKEDLEAHLTALGWLVLDLGTHTRDPVDYPDIAERVARAVAEGRASEGILVDGAGIGSAIAANKVPGVRAAKCDSLFDARNAREHNHANVLTLGARMERTAMRQLVRVFLETSFGGGRHERRVRKIEGLERRARMFVVLAVALVAAGCNGWDLPNRPPKPRRVELDTAGLASLLPTPSPLGLGWQRDEPSPIDPSTLPGRYGEAARVGVLADYLPADSSEALVLRLVLFDNAPAADRAFQALIRRAQFRDGRPLRSNPPLGTDCYLGAMPQAPSWRLLLLRGPFVAEIAIPDERGHEAAQTLARHLDGALRRHWPDG